MDHTGSRHETASQHAPPLMSETIGSSRQIVTVKTTLNYKYERDRKIIMVVRQQRINSKKSAKTVTHPSKKMVTRSLVPARQKTEYGSPWPQLATYTINNGRYWRAVSG